MAAETWISVDVEASGPAPHAGSLLAIGACLVDDEAQGIELLLRPEPGMPWSADAQAIHGLDRATLERDGLEPAQAMADLERWVHAVTPEGSRPVFVGLNAPFDWMWVADAFWRHLGRNPFGPSALDIKSLYLGRYLGEGLRWADTGRARMLERYPVTLPHPHTALADAREQAVLCRRILEGAGVTRPATRPPRRPASGQRRPGR
jgi:DNA polymerase III epsilon subunit-like protein